MKTCITNAYIILQDQVLKSDALMIEDGYISEISPTKTEGAKLVDWKRRFLMPGMIDLHSDAIEKIIEPRAGVFFPFAFGTAQVDRLNAMSGITTAFHAISFADEEFGTRSVKTASNIVHHLNRLKSKGLVDHRVHCRYEITDQESFKEIKKIIPQKQIDMLSFMDHTPGQGQFKDALTLKNYLIQNHGMSDIEASKVIDKKKTRRESAFERIQQLCDDAINHKISLSSHDDDSPDRVEQLKKLGVSISEFPINLETAYEAKRQELTTVFGAPNTLRGKSQSGSMKALEAIENGVADCLCSDYVPSALISAVFKLPTITDLNISDAVKMVSLHPAKAAGLDDRGEIKVGLKADFIGVSTIKDQHLVSDTWRDGKPVLTAGY